MLNLRNPCQQTNRYDIFWNGENYCQNCEKQYSSSTWYLLLLRLSSTEQMDIESWLINYAWIWEKELIAFKKLKPFSWRKSRILIVHPSGFPLLQSMKCWTKVIFTKQYQELGSRESFKCSRLWCSAVDMLFILHKELQEICWIPE